MSRFERVLQGIHSGEKVRIVVDSYGQKRVELAGSWLPIRRRWRLTRDEMSMVEVALKVRLRSQSGQGKVKV